MSIHRFRLMSTDVLKAEEMRLSIGIVAMRDETVVTVSLAALAYNSFVE